MTNNRLLLWVVLSLAGLGGAMYFWGLGERWAGRGDGQGQSVSPGAGVALKPQAGVKTVGTSSFSTAPQFLLLSEGAAKSASAAADPFAYRLNNTGRSAGQLLREERAILLENALIDTARPLGFAIPAHLRVEGDPGSYLVQARGPVDEGFRSALKGVGAQVVSYIPNHAYLVRVSAAGAEALRGHPRTAAVLGYEPYYKLKASLLGLAVKDQPLPEGARLNVMGFADARAETREALQQLGVEVLAEARSPFGPVWTVRPAVTGWTELARLPGVQVVEWHRERVSANDLSRVRLGVSVDTLVATNYLGLTGSNVMVNVNDTGVSAGHPDLLPRVFGDSAASLVDANGHGTHVAGIIAGSGISSTNPANVGQFARGSVTNADFRGKAPGARIFSMATGLGGPLPSDEYLQERAVRTNALISNNSWHYGGDNTYGIGAANYDAAVRDALPGVPGSQPLLFVFPAGNGAGGDNSGLSGDPETVLSPGTAKNVITVGAIEQLRDITNGVVPNFATCRTTNINGTNVTICATNTPWRALTSSDNQVAAFSGRGNVGIGIEGDFGRFKPDLVAPGTFVVSTRSLEWDERAYYNPTSHHVNVFRDQVVPTNALNNYNLFVPQNAVQVFIDVVANVDSPSPFPDVPIFVRQADIPTTNVFDFVVTNSVSIPPDTSLTPVGAPWFYSVGNITTQNLSLDIITDIVTTNDLGNYYEVLSNLNNSLSGGSPPHRYRYESGTSMSAADASGTLALMQEFFETRLRVTNSPALYKALLINGARSVNSLYDFQVENTVNFQGWGLIQLPNSLPESVTNGVTHVGASAMQIFDQSPTNALATGQRQTRRVRVSEEAVGLGLPLRVTLVWTDPPGNPAAGVKLVNDLDLVVTNLDTGEVYLGNDIGPSSNFTFPWNTNTPPNSDAINNVENVYLLPPLGTNYAVAVIGRQVNVNAVTAHSNNVAQDYALVISYGNGEVPDALEITQQQPVVGANQWTLTGITNDFRTPTISGQLLLGQHVGANTPLLGVTNGLTNQWHFYVITNTTTFTNAAFVTFLPPTLALPRLGVREDNVNNATRREADIDLYVSDNAGLLSLDPVVIASADRSRGRGGTELIAYSNSVPNRVYYIGVKSEDQMAAEYAFLAVFSLDPFSGRDGNGNLIVPGIPIPATVPDGSPADPGVALVLGLAIESVPLRRVVVLTNAYFHENPGDLLGTLSHGEKFAVLNNHRAGLLGEYSYVYEDHGEGEPLGARHTDGPGSLQDFVGEEGLGVWLFAMTDNSLNATGEVRALTLRLEPQNLDTNSAVRTVPPNRFTFDFIDVPIAATNLTVCVASNTQPMELYLRRGEFPTRALYDYTVTLPPGGGCLSIDKSDLPPLTSGRYFIGVFNSSGVVQTILLTATLQLDPTAVVPITFDSVGNEPLLDDAVNYSSIFVPDRARIAQVEVGLRIDHPRISDLAFHLISPRGTRVLLMENRGNTNSASAGSSILTTNVTTEVNSFETALAGSVPIGFPVEGWTVTSNFVTVLQNPALAHTGARMLSLRAGAIERNYATTPGANCTFTYVYRRMPTLDGIVSWWPGEGAANDVVGTNHGTLVNGAGFAPGNVNGAFSFGSNSYVRVGTNSSLTMSNAFSVDVWIFPTGPGGNSVYGGIIVNKERQYELARFADGTIQWAVANTGPGWFWVNSGFVAPTNQWTHLAWTYDLGLSRVFANGVLVQTYAGSGPVGTAPGLSFNEFRIGNRQEPALAQWFQGRLDEVTLYNRALTATEVQDIYAAGAAGKCGLTAPPANCLSFPTQVIIDGITNTFTALNANWVTNTINFMAMQTNTFAAFNALGANSGLLLDTISLRQTLIVTQNFYLTFTEDTNRTSTPIKFASPPFATGTTSTNFFVSGFEPALAGDYVTPAVVDGWNVLTTNRASVLNDPVHTGTNSLALLLGEIQRTLPTTPGRGYRLDFAYRGVTNLNPVSWWPGDLNATDVVDGNNGTLLGGVTYSQANVNQGFTLNGLSGSGVRVGNAANLRLQDFTIETWIKRASPIVASFDFNGGIIFGYGPGGYNLAMFDDGTPFLGKVTVDFVAPNVRITDTNLHHVAVTKLGTVVIIYVDGVAYPAPSYPTVFTFNTPAAIGARGDNLVNSFYGTVDEVSIFDHALTASEVRDIYAAGAAGKCGTITPPSLCPLAGAQVFIPGVVTNTFTGATNWLTNSLAFTAPANGTPVALTPASGGQAGVLLDTFTLTEFAGSVYYLPEESLAALINENAFGLWRLEILDTRTGATNQANLVGWQLQFVYQTDIPLPGVLTHGEPRTNTIPAGQTAYYIVDVPAWAQFATNILHFANPAPGVNVLFNQNQPPSPQLTNAGDLTLIGPNATSGSRTIDTTGAPLPPLLPGQRYYLGVHNPGAAPVTYALQVDFDITPLFNGVPVTSTLNIGALPRYFYYDVSTNATAVSYQLTNLNGNVELVASQGTPLPTLNSFDYGSFNPSTSDESIFVFTNSNPVNLSPGRWYLGVFNTDLAPVTYTIVANEYTNLAPFITLTNGIPYFNTSSGAGSAIDYYRYVVTGNVARAQFEINNPSADLTLVARKGFPLPNLGLFDYLSANPQNNDELIVLFTNSTPVALTTGDWFLSAVNISGGPANYSIKATQWPVTGRPFIITDHTITGNSFCLTWTSLPGTHYYVQGVTNLSSTTNDWVTLSPTITATGPVTTWCLPLPSSFQYFRVVEGLALNTFIPAPVITSIVHTNNTVELRWSGPSSATYQVQWTPALVPPAWNTFTNLVTSTTGQFLFVDDGTQTAGLNTTRFYRLRLATP